MSLRSLHEFVFSFVGDSEFSLYLEGENSTSPTAAPSFAPTPFPELRVRLPRGYLELNFALQIIIAYLVLFQGIALLVIFWWFVYPLPADEQVSIGTLITSLFSVFVLVGDYLSDGLVAIAILVGDLVTTEDEQDLNVELFSKLVFAGSTSCIGVAILAQAWQGKKGSELDPYYFFARFLGVATGVYPFYLLLELVTTSYYGDIRAKLTDIVSLKYIQGTVEGIPQIGLLLYLNLQDFEGLAELVGISIAFSVVSLVSGVVMYDFVRETYDKDDFVDSANDVNYLFYSPYLGKLGSIENSKRKWFDYELWGWLFHSIFTRFLECFGRLAFYSTFSLCTGGWGLVGLVLVDVILLLRYHRFVFFLHVWLELIFNLRDEGNVYIAKGEWQAKFATTFIGYMVIMGRMLRDSTIIELNNTQASAVVFYLGLVSNLVLYPWILYMFRRQTKLTGTIEQLELQQALSEPRLEGMRTFDNYKAKSQSNFFWNWNS